MFKHQINLINIVHLRVVRQKVGKLTDFNKKERRKRNNNCRYFLFFLFAKAEVKQSQTVTKQVEVFEAPQTVKMRMWKVHTVLLDSSGNWLRNMWDLRYGSHHDLLSDVVDILNYISFTSSICNIWWQKMWQLVKRIFGCSFNAKRSFCICSGWSSIYTLP